MVSDIVWRNFKEVYPERAREIRIIREPYSYFSYDELVGFTNPTISETKKILIQAYSRADKHENENLQKYTMEYDNSYEKEYEKYHTTKEVIQILSQRLINYNITDKDVANYWENGGD